jgi:DNA-binding transcriptional regulator PaaX
MSSSKAAAGKIQKEILKSLGRGIKSLITIKVEVGAHRNTINRSLKQLENKGLINLGGEIIKLTPEGQRIIKTMRIYDVRIENKSWDNLWKIVAYDIPEEKKIERDIFRRKLKELGFFKIQGSMWLFPYECRNEIIAIAHNLKINPFVIYLKTDQVPNQKKFIKNYNL